MSLAVTRLPSDLLARLDRPVIGALTLRVAEIEIHLGAPRLGGLQRGARELRVRHGVVGFLLPDRALFRERLQARDLAIGLRELGAGARDLGLGGGGLRLERLRIDEEQRLAGLHPSAFGEEALLEDARDARAHLDFLRAGRLADVFVGDGQRSSAAAPASSRRRAESRGSRPAGDWPQAATSAAAAMLASGHERRAEQRAGT